MYKIVIIEDESLIAKELQYKLKDIAPDFEVIQTLPSVKTANRWFMENAEPDLIFADIQLGDGVSFEIFKNFQLSCPVIFTTAYDEYALQAFKVNGIDYLLKPIDTDELTSAITKARTILESKSHYPRDLQSLVDIIRQPDVLRQSYKTSFIVQSQKQWIPIQVSDIACFSKDALNFIYTLSGERYVLDFTTLEEVEALLDPHKFFRANRQHIINYDAILKIKPHENQKLTVTLKGPQKLETDISREKAPVFKKWLER
ncbi:MAG: response regulator transcription factor [Saprospiraceae bacterium]|nr:response regulator transcription factor [Saprospiraceae bacterium]